MKFVVVRIHEQIEKNSFNQLIRNKILYHS